MRKFVFGIIVITGGFMSCDNYFKNDYEDNSPTSGKLKVYCDEGLTDHVKNQVATFESQYYNAHVELTSTSEAEAVDALYKDSCKVIVISRPLNENEKKAFATKDLSPLFSIVAYSGVALITNGQTNLRMLSMDQLKQLLSEKLTITDATNKSINLSVVFESNRSSVINYLKDSIVNGKSFSSNCSAVKNSLEVINYVSNTPNTIGFIDFAWLSDRDDSLYKAVMQKIKFVPVGRGDGKYFEPNQSSFKTGEYPLTRGVYVYRQASEFSLAKGFATFVAGPKGQTTFLKQGLLPSKQQERSIQITTQ